MIMPILLFLGLYLPGQRPVEVRPLPDFAARQVDQQTFDRQQQEIERQRAQIQSLSSELRQTVELIQRELRPTCEADIRWLPGRWRITDLGTPLTANLFSNVSAPAETCLPSEIRITATFFNAADSFVCSGAVTVSQNSRSQNTNFEFRPFDLEYFAKWWDGEGVSFEKSSFHLLKCTDFEGIEVRDPAGQATLLRLYATAFPKRGGLATSEIIVQIPRIPR